MAEDIMKVRLSAEGIQEVMDALKKVRAETEKTGRAGKEAVDTLGSLGTIFAAQQIAAFAKHALDAADGLSKMSQKTGVAVEELSALTYMGQQAEVSNQDLEKGLVKLAKSLTGLEQGEAVATEAFSRLGLSAADFKGLSLDQALLKVANAQARFADGAGKADTMLALLGKSGANMIPLMNDLANGGFENAKKKLEDLGLVITGDMAKASQDFNDSMKRLEMAAQGATVQVAQSMLPGLTQAIDGLTKSLAQMPAGAKAFAGSFVVIGSAATAAAVAVRALSTAFVGLGPAGIALVALSALAAGLMAYQAAQEEAHQKDLQDIAAKGRMIKDGDKLVDQYRKEAAALEKAGTNKKEAAKHAAELKKIEDKLIEISPAYLQILKDETKGINEKADAMKALDLAQKKALETQLAQLKADRDKLATAVAAGKSARPVEGVTGEGGATEFAAVDVIPALEEKLKKANETIAGIEQALGISKAPGQQPTGPSKPNLAVVDAALAKAQAAKAASLAKQQADEQKIQLDAYSALTEDLYKRGLIDLSTFLAARRTAIEQGSAAEVAVLEAQIKAEIAARTKGMTPAEKLQSETKVADLQAQIVAKREQAQVKLDTEERKGREEREKNAEEALKLEAELAKAKGMTGEAGIRAIEAEYDRRIELARTPEAKAALQGLKGQATASGRLGDAQLALDQGQQRFNAQIEAVDLQRGQGLITEEEAVRRKIELYKQLIPVLEAAAAEQMRLAQLTGNPADLIKAQENANGVEQLKLNLKGLGEQMDWVKTTARDAFEQGLGNFLETLLDQTTSLTDKVLALGRAIAQALLQQASTRLAASITTSLFGAAAGKAEGGAIYGPGTSTSDSVPIWASSGEYMVKAAAVQRYGLGFMDALNGMRLPKGSIPRFADGGLVGPPTVQLAGGSPAPRVRVIVVNNEREAMEALMNGPAGERAVLQHINRNPQALGKDY